MAEMMIKRHSRVTMFMHWFNAFCWFFLLATGFGLIDNKDLQPFGGWWTELMRSIFGAPETILLLHELCGLIWAGVFLVYVIFYGRQHVFPFIKEILTFSPVNDLLWLAKKNIQMMIGTKWLPKFGFTTKIPDQGFYNIGQKLFAVASVIGSIAIVVTGVIMVLSDIYLKDTGIVQWSMLIHFIAVIAVLSGLLIHIYMAGISPDERPALISMFTATVPESYASHHHKLWYDQVQSEAKQKDMKTDASS